MSNRIAIALMILAALALAADHLLTDSAATLFLARKFVDLVDYIAIWH